MAAGRNNTKVIKGTLYLARIAVLSAMGVVLMLLEIAYPLFPWLKLELGDLPVIVAAFGMDPFSGVLISIVKNVISFVMGFSMQSLLIDIIGGISNILMGSSVSLICGFIYKKKHDLKGVIIGLAMSVIAVLIVAAISNYAFIKVIGADKMFSKLKIFGHVPTLADYYIFGVIPFNLIKFTTVSIVSVFVYKWTKYALFNDRFFLPGRYKRSYFSYGAKRTMRIAARLGRKLRGGEVIALSGDLGAGKTVFCKGLARGLGVTDEVVSPTFTIHQQYKSGRLTLNHFDMYRAGEGDIEAFYEIMSDEGQVSVVEWAENTPELIPANAIIVVIKTSAKNRRYIEITR